MSGPALAVSVGFIVFCSVLAVIGRRVVAATIKSQLIKELIYEAIASAELCACCFELIIGESRFFNMTITIKRTLKIEIS